MKKVCAGILMAALVFGSAGCGETKNDPAANTEDISESNADIAKFNLENGTVLLNSGYMMPVLGIGCFTLSNDEAENSVYWALRDGYRLIDTARIYGNEEGVGRGIQRAICIHYFV